MALTMDTVASVNGLTVTTTQGYTLTRIGNKSLSKGDTIYTDGKYVYGMEGSGGKQLPMLPSGRYVFFDYNDYHLKFLSSTSFQFKSDTTQIQRNDVWMCADNKHAYISFLSNIGDERFIYNLFTGEKYAFYHDYSIMYRLPEDAIVDNDGNLLTAHIVYGYTYGYNGYGVLILKNGEVYKNEPCKTIEENGVTYNTRPWIIKLSKDGSYHGLFVSDSITESSESEVIKNEPYDFDAHFDPKTIREVSAYNNDGKNTWFSNAWWYDGIYENPGANFQPVMGNLCSFADARRGYGDFHIFTMFIDKITKYRVTNGIYVLNEKNETLFKIDTTSIFYSHSFGIDYEDDERVITSEFYPNKIPYFDKYGTSIKNNKILVTFHNKEKAIKNGAAYNIKYYYFDFPDTIIDLNDGVPNDSESYVSSGTSFLIPFDSHKEIKCSNIYIDDKATGINNISSHNLQGDCECNGYKFKLTYKFNDVISVHGKKMALCEFDGLTLDGENLLSIVSGCANFRFAKMSPYNMKKIHKNLAKIMEESKG